MMFFSKLSNPSSPPPPPVNKSNDYKEANYFNFFRVLENKNQVESTFRSRTCLLPPQHIQKNVFKLDSFDISSEMVDTSIVSLWTQTYSNDSTSPVEAKYQLPLSPLSVVSRFVVEYKDKILEAKIKEKSKAQEKYNDAIASGGQAFLGEKTDDGLFNFQIGNLPPNEKITIRLTMVSEIGTHLDSLHYCLHRFMFPMGKFNFNYNLNISLSSAIKNIELDHYKPSIKYSDNKKKATVSFSTSDGIQKNIIAIVSPQSTDKPQPTIEFDPKDKSYALGLSFYPVFDGINREDVYQKSEYIFVVDCSGSMSGTPINKAKRALEICVRALNENNKFNIYCFGSSFTKVFDKSRLYNDESLDTASSYIDRIGANLGGTELLPPIRDILSTESDPEYPRQVFILTDGEISSRDQLIDYVGKESNSTRMFTFGIGNSVDRELVIGLSKACKGYFEFIQENNDMEEKVMKLLSIANEPTLSNITIDWGELSVTQAPTQIRPVFNRERLMVYGLLNKEPTNTSAPFTITMIGDGPLGDKLRFPITLDFSKDLNSSSNQIHTLAAFKQIQDLEESERKEKKDHKDKIVQLGKLYGLVSKHTSYIVTSEGDGEVTEESMKTINVLKDVYNHPQLQFQSQSSQQSFIGGSMMRGRNMTKSFSASPQQGCPPPPPSSSSYSLPPCPPPPGGCAPPPAPVYMTSLSSCAPPPAPSASMNILQSPVSKSSPMVTQSLRPSASLSYQQSTPVNNNDPLLALLKLQKANGSFTKSTITQFTIDNSKAPSELSSPERIDIWVTLLVIAKISKDHQQQRNQWENVLLKSIKWVKQQLRSINLLESYDKFESLSKSIFK